MAWQKNYGDEAPTSDIAWDLRQGYIKILQETLERISDYRGKRDYKNWFEELDGLYIDISMHLNGKEDDDKTTEKDYYQSMLRELNTEINANPAAYRNENIESNKIYTCLKKINMWLLSKMKYYDIFGSKPAEDDEY